MEAQKQRDEAMSHAQAVSAEIFRKLSSKPATVIGPAR